MFQILVVLTFKEPGGQDFGMRTEVLKFNTVSQAEVAFAAIGRRFPINAIHASAVKLY